MSNPFQLTFTLKQHTPIIHFQHEQAGATLRASEVKPKLDRFIMEHLTNRKGFEAVKEFESISKENTGWQSWLVGEGKSGHLALNYKLTISPDLSSEEDFSLEIPQTPDRFGTYKTVRDREFGSLILANMGGKTDRSELKDLKFYRKHLCTISSFIPALIAKIDELFNLFIATRNFGNRQTKGFGSFSVIHKILNNRTINVSFPVPFDTWSLEIDTDNPKDIALVVDYYWKRLKSGLNYGDRWNDGNKYKKSELYQYLKSQTPWKYTWEKRWLKENFYGLPVDPSLPEPRFVRARLGLPDKFEFVKLPQKEGLRKKKYNEIEGDYLNKINWRIKVTHPEIDRIPSPIIFKPICDAGKTSIYLLIQEQIIPTDIMTLQFEFTPEPYTINKSFVIKLNFNDEENLEREKQRYLYELGKLRDKREIGESDFQNGKLYLYYAKKVSLGSAEADFSISDLLNFYNKRLRPHFTAIPFNGTGINVIVSKTSENAR